MYRVTVLYGTPTDTDAFDTYYRDIHIPIASRMRGLTGWNLTSVSTQDGDLTPPIYLIADLYAHDRDAMTAVLESPEGLAAQQDVANFATGGATFLFGDETSVATA